MKLIFLSRFCLKARKEGKKDEEIQILRSARGKLIALKNWINSE